MRLGYAFKQARLRRFPNGEKTQGEIAAEVGITQTYLSGIETGRNFPSLDVVDRLCKVYKVPPVVIFWWATEQRDVRSGRRSDFNELKSQMDIFIQSFI